LRKASKDEKGDVWLDVMSTPDHRSSGPALPIGNDVPLDECFPIDEAPARSANCISFGPHNILQVCSQWTISFFLGSLLVPAQQCQIRHHPLCHRNALESVETVVGAKWSTSLLPEVFYPATARVCVQTTSNLVVYRVSRHGAARVEASKGIGIACCRRRHAKDTNSVANASRETARSTPSRKGKPCATTGSAQGSGDDFVLLTSTTSSCKRKVSAKVSGAPEKKKKKVVRAAAQKQKPRRRDSGDDDDDDDEDDSDTSISSSSSSSTDDRGSRSSSSGSNNPRSDSKAKTSAADAAISMCGGRRGSATASGACLNHDAGDALTHSSSATVVDYLWLSNDNLVILSTRGLHLVSFYGDLSDDVNPQIRDLPPPVYTWGGVADTAALGFGGPTPVCLAPVATSGLSAQAASTHAFLRRALVVASPYLMRVLHVSSDAPQEGTPAKVQLIQLVEVPSLFSVPTAICCVASPPASASVAPSDQTDSVDVVAFVAAPSLILRGRFTLPVYSSSTASVPLPSRTSTWTPDALFGPDQLVGEVGLRGLLVAPFTVEVPSTPGSAWSLSTTPTTSRVMCTSVLGIGERSLVQYLLWGPSYVTLFQCPLLAGRSEMPLHKCAGVSGVALHPTGTVAVMVLQSGHSSLEPMHLLPVSVDGADSWLRRFVEFSGAVTGEGDGPAAAQQQQDSSQHWCSTKSLARRQLSCSYFMRECLLCGSTAHSSDLHRYADVLHETQQMPSIETLRNCRALAEPRGVAAPSPALLIPDLGLRHTYLQLRSQHGVALFLRWPLPPTPSVNTEAGDFVTAAFASAGEMEAIAASWPWWRLLRHIWGSCPWDRPVLQELLLSNAVRIVAKWCGYANMAFSNTEFFRKRRGTETRDGVTQHPQAASMDASRCATEPDTVDVDGARCFIEGYVQQQEAQLRRAAQGGADSAASSHFVAVLTAADCESSALLSLRVKGPRSITKASCDQLQTRVHWCVSQPWVSALKDFLAATNNENLCPSDSTAGASDRVRFPCSLCDRDNVATFDMSLSSTSRHVPLSSEAADDGGSSTVASASSAAAHTTLFSGTTFCPLSFFSPDYVLTRCLACGLSDYADGPLCRVCGGLLE
jgi:hypothetical protein